MTEETANTTTETSTQEGLGSQETEIKNQNQAEAFKRLQKENESFKLKEKEAKDAEAAKEKAEADRIAREENPEKFDRDSLKQELKDELKSDLEKDTQLNNVLGKYPQLEEHRTKIKQYINDASRKGVPVDEIVAGAVGIESLIKLGAEIGSEALIAAENSKNGGGNAEIKIQTDSQKQEQHYMDTLPSEFK